MGSGFMSSRIFFSLNMSNVGIRSEISRNIRYTERLGAFLPDFFCHNNTASICWSEISDKKEVSVVFSSIRALKIIKKVIREFFDDYPFQIV